MAATQHASGGCGVVKKFATFDMGLVWIGVASAKGSTYAMSMVKVIFCGLPPYSVYPHATQDKPDYYDFWRFRMSAALHGTPAQIRQATWATRSLFAALGVVAGAWGVHIPSVKELYGLTEGSLSFVLVAAAVGAVSALFFAGRAIGRLGTGNAVAVAGTVMGIMLALSLHWPGYVSLVLAMVVFGSTMSVYDVGINTEGSALEAAGGRPIMGGLHGMFSVGAMVGAALAALLLRLDVSASWQLGGMGLFVSVWMVLASRWMLPTAPATGDVAQVPQFAWPRGKLLVIGLLIFSGMSAEGVMQDWCVLYLKQEVRMPQDQAAIGLAAFAGAMAVMRFIADGLRARYSERRLLRASGVVTAVAMAIVLLSGNPVISILGFAVIGAGLAMVVPILFGAASRVPGTTPAAAIAAVSSIGYSGFMVGPPLIGGIAQYASLSAALVVVIVAASILALSAHCVPEKQSARAAGQPLPA
jgi:fucose permease